MNHDTQLASDVLGFALKREITLLFKKFLFTVEQIKDDNNHALYKLSQSPNAPSVRELELVNPLDDHKYQQIRKFILDAGNDVLRAVDEEFKKYKVEFTGPKS